MAYITKSDFNGYTDTEITETEFTILAERASDVIDIITTPHRGGGRFNTLSASQRHAVVKAVCAEVETLNAQGGVSALTGNADATAALFRSASSAFPAAPARTAPVASVLINGIPVSPLVTGYLMRTGLTGACTRMKPIPRKLLIHTVAHKANPVSNGWGETYATERTLYCVRLEPSSKIVKGRDNTELRLATTLFYDSANSRPRDVTFAPGDLIVLTAPN